MPSGKTHEKVNSLFLIPTILILGHYVSFDTEGIILSILFILKWIWNSKYFTPDSDTKSRPRKRLGFLGWIVDKMFGHRKTLHSALFWGVVFVVEYYLFGWWTLGGVFPVYSHLILDKLF